MRILTGRTAVHPVSISWATAERAILRAASTKALRSACIWYPLHDAVYDDPAVPIIGDRYSSVPLFFLHRDVLCMLQ